MKLSPALEGFYSKYSLKDGFDTRTQIQIMQQQQFVGSLSKKNIEALKIQLTGRKSKKYSPSQLERLDLGDGIYCNLTDNHVMSQQAILTLHGAPGNHTDWAGLENEMNGKYRWINLMIPGIDGEDERRGSYDGTLNGFCDLFLRTVTKLKLKRVIICAHSFGTTVGFSLAYSLPSIVEGFINLAGVCSLWPIGMTYMYISCVADNEFYQDDWKNKKLYDKDQHRDIIYQKYLNNFKQKQYGKIKIPLLSKNQYFGFLKLTFQNPQHFGSLFSRYIDLQMLRVLAFANSDHIITRDRFQLSIYALINDQKSYLHQPKWQKLFKTIKPTLEKQIKEKLGIEVQGDKIQEYLCVAFDETGHNIQRRRPEELSKIIQVYLISLQVIYESKILVNSSL